MALPLADRAEVLFTAFSYRVRRAIRERMRRGVDVAGRALAPHAGTPHRFGGRRLPPLVERGGHLEVFPNGFRVTWSDQALEEFDRGSTSQPARHVIGIDVARRRRMAREVVRSLLVSPAIQAGVLR